jgi:hypothetical protein
VLGAHFLHDVSDTVRKLESDWEAFGVACRVSVHLGEKQDVMEKAVVRTVSYMIRDLKGPGTWPWG